jgi:arsenite methyltransferase
MEDKVPTSPEKPPESAKTYFDLQAGWGITKHFGDLRATQELAAECHVGTGSYVLVVGCGVGITPCYLAKQHGCRVVGVDLSREMVDRSNERAKKQDVQDLVEFRQADAQELPFGDSLFDAVMCESVNAFISDRKKAAREYARVVKPGGYVGLNECVWVEPPPPGMADYMWRVMGAEFFSSHEGWKELLETCGLNQVIEMIHTTNTLSQWSGEVRQMEFREMASAYLRFPLQCISSPACRRFAREALRMPRGILRMFKYFGYGLYVGRKPGKTAGAS